MNEISKKLAELWDILQDRREANTHEALDMRLEKDLRRHLSLRGQEIIGVGNKYDGNIREVLPGKVKKAIPKIVGNAPNLTPEQRADIERQQAEAKKEVERIEAAKGGEKRKPKGKGDDKNVSAKPTKRRRKRKGN